MIIGILTIFILSAMLIFLNIKNYSIVTGVITEINCDTNSIKVKYTLNNNLKYTSLDVKPNYCKNYTVDSELLLKIYTDKVEINEDNNDDIIRSLLIVLILVSIIITFLI